jgi:hypothetical protein
MVSSLHQVFNFGAFEGVDSQLKDLLGSVVGNVFDAHSSGGGVDKNWAASCSIESDTKIHLLGNLDLLHKVHLLNLKAVFTRLLGDQVVSEHVSGNLSSPLGAVDDMNASLESVFFKVSKTSSTCKHL